MAERKARVSGKPQKGLHLGYIDLLVGGPVSFKGRDPQVSKVEVWYDGRGDDYTIAPEQNHDMLRLGKLFLSDGRNRHHYEEFYQDGDFGQPGHAAPSVIYSVYIKE